MLKNIIKFIFSIIIIISSTNTVFSNNISISNVSLEGNNTINKYAFIKFDMSGENVWRTSTGAENWGAIWVFVKYRVDDGIWQHALLSKIDTEHINSNSLVTDAQSDGMGLFIFYGGSNEGNFATFNLSDLKVRWNYGENGLIGNESDIDIQVFGIEMVYIPQASFFIGSGGTEFNHFYTYPNSNSPYEITNENEIIVNNNSGSLYYSSNEGPYNEGGDQSGPIPANYPKGYNAFYIMRYEISQEQYVDYLNTLTRTQQDIKVDASYRYVLSESNTMQNRNGIICNSPAAGAPYTFSCDYNSGSSNQADDGQNIACNFINWDDGLSYLDWSGLRPMTELEFEKACRGTVTPVINEFAWGTTEITMVNSTINNEGETNEIVNNTGNGLCNYDEDGEFGSPSPIDAPLRCGFAATNLTNKVQAGSSFYGVMELSGNLSEHCVSVGNSEGRSFTGNNGDGNILTPTNWPDFNAYADRGGNFTRDITRLQTSDRSRAIISDNSKFSNVGWRGVRSAQ